MNPVRRLYRRSHRLRRVIRRRKDAITYHARATSALWLPRQVTLAARAALRRSRRRSDLRFALPRRAELALAHSTIAYGDDIVRRRQASRSRAPRFATPRGASSRSAKLDDIRARFDEYVTVEGWEHVRRRARRRQAAPSSSPATSATGSCSRPTSPREASRSRRIARRINDPRLNQLLVDFRAHNGVRTILRESPSSSREIIQVLRSAASWPCSSTRTSRRRRSPCRSSAARPARPSPRPPWPSGATCRWCRASPQRRPEGGHRFTSWPRSIRRTSGDRRRDVVELTRRFSEVLEEQRPPETRRMGMVAQALAAAADSPT